MKDAIKLAIEGGYKGEIMFKYFPPEGDEIDHFLLDPLFWQALGKSLGWKESRHELFTDGSGAYYCRFCGQNFPELKCIIGIECPKAKPYLYYWHHFIDHLAEEKDSELFFKELLK